MNELNAWLAEQVGITGILSDSFILPSQHEYGITKWYEWNYLDPRCRQIIREHFKIKTEVYEDGWMASTWYQGDIEMIEDTIEAAETACIEAIWRNRDENTLRA